MGCSYARRRSVVSQVFRVTDEHQPSQVNPQPPHRVGLRPARRASSPTGKKQIATIMTQAGYPAFFTSRLHLGHETVVAIAPPEKSLNASACLPSSEACTPGYPQPQRLVKLRLELRTAFRTSRQLAAGEQRKQPDWKETNAHNNDPHREALPRGESTAVRTRNGCHLLILQR